MSHSHWQHDLRHGCGGSDKLVAQQEDPSHHSEQLQVGDQPGAKRKTAHELWNSWPWRSSDGGCGERSRPSKKFKAVATEAAPGSSSRSSPGSNSSDITTDQYMAAESSSKSSCLDDACTLATTTSTTTLATGARRSTSEPSGGATGSISVSAYRNFPDVDRQFHHPLVALAQQKEASQFLSAKVAEEVRPRQQQHLAFAKAEDSEVITAHGVEVRHHSASKQASEKGIDDYSLQQDSWLQLGLGPSRRSSASPPPRAQLPQQQEHQAIARSQALSEYPADDQDEVDVSRQPKPVLHLFPSESVHQIPGYSPHSPRRMPSSQFASHGGTTSSTDFYFGGAPHVPPVRFDSSRDVAAYREQEVAGLLKSMKEAPSTQLTMSYSSSHAATAPYTATADAVRFINQQRKLSMLAESLVPYQDQRAASFSEPPLHHGYGDGSFPLGAFEDKRFLYGNDPNPATAAFTGRRPTHQEGSSTSSWKNEGVPPFAPSRTPPSDNVYVPGPSTFHPASRMLPSASQPAHEDWQALIKRLGGSIQIQSVFPKAAEDDLQHRARSNLRDLQEQWTSQQEIKPAAWSRHHILRGHDMMKTMPQFSFPGFEAQAAQGWYSQSPAPPIAGLPFLQQLVAEGSREQRRNIFPGRDHDLWFFLRAKENEDSELWLPQIPKGYLRVKDEAVPVSHVKKYLVHKLGLSCESEVEISCRGQILQPGMSLQHVRDVIWHSNAAAAGDQTGTATMTAATAAAAAAAAPGVPSANSSTRNIVMELNYRRPSQSQTQQFLQQAPSS